MPIPVQSVIDRMAAALDAEGSDRYLFEQDYKPAINYSIEWVTLVVNRAMENTKYSGEALRELTKISVFQANNFSRVAFNPQLVGNKLWSILGIFTEIKTHPFQQPTPDADKAKSKYMPSLAYVSGKSCTNRLSIEQWNDNQDNVFMPGNNKLSGPLSEYAYLNFADYSAIGYNDPGTFATEIRPSVANKYVAIAYTKKPDEVTAQNESIAFPETMMNMIVEAALNFISFKQGNQTTLYLVTDKDIQRITSMTT